MKKMNSQQHAIMATTTKSHPWLQLQLNCKLKIIGAIINLIFIFNISFAQVSYLGLDGGFEGTASIDNTNVYAAPQTGIWAKANATQTIANETSVVRSGSNSLRINNTSSTGRRVWSPLVSCALTTSAITIQYYRYVTNTSNTQENQEGTYRTSVENLQGTYDVPSAAGIWEKQTYNPTSSTYTSVAGVIMHRQLGSGGNMYIDDMCIYTGGVDNTAPNSPGTVTVNNPTTSTLDVSWVAASGGVDGGGYVVVRYATSPNADNDPNQNGIYAVGNTHTNGTGGLTGTIRYIGTGTSFTDNVGLSPGTTYYYKVYTVDKAFNYSTESTGSGTTSSIGCSAPTTQASNITFSSITSSSMTVNWTNGNGSYRIVKINTSNSFTNPTDGSDPAANPVYGGSGEQVVYNGSGNSVNVTGLSPSTTYWFRVYEFNCTGTNTKFLTSTATNNPNSQATSVAAPEINVKGNGVSIADGDATPSLADHTDFDIANVAGGTVDRVFTIENLGTTNLILSGTPLVAVSGAHASDFTVTVQPSTPIAPSGSTTFTVRFDPSAAGLRTATLTILNNDSDEGTYDFAIQGTGSTACATDLIISEYVEGSSNNKYIEIYNGTGVSINLSDYKLQLYANGVSSPPTNDVTLSGTLNPNSVIVYKNNFATIYGGTSTTNAAVNFNGNDAVALYKISTSSFVDIIGRIGEDPGDEWQNGSHSTLDKTLVRKSTVVSGITTNPISGFPTLVSEWDVYNIDVVTNLGSHTMTCGCSAPSVQATFNAFSGVTGTSITVNWARGNGDYVMLVARENAAVTATPTNNTTYAADAAFGAGSTIGAGQYVVYSGTGTSVNVTGLTGNTIYHFALFEFNCDGGNEMYLIPANVASQGTINYIATSAIVGSPFCVTAIDDASVMVNFTYASAGSFAGSTFTAELSDASGSFASPVSLGTIASNVSGSQSISGIIPAGTLSGTGYRIRVIADVPAIVGSDNQSNLTIVLGPENVIANAPNEGNTQVGVSWTNPAGCYDEILVVAKLSAAIIASPTGDGSAYSANASFGSGTAFDGGYVVYKGAGTSVTVTALTNGQTYYFKIFTRKGTEWSNGTEFTAIPASSTILNYGDLAIVAINTDNDSNDEISFVAFKTILPGSSIDLTDNGYERLYAGQWGDSEGSINLLRKGTSSSIPSGTVITILGRNTTWNVYVNGALDNANWTITCGLGNQFDLNTDDQVWILQGGTWTNPGENHDATYSGNILYGWTATGWKTAPGYNDTKGSTKPASCECSATDVNGLTFKSKGKFIGPMTACTKMEWIGRINDKDNWNSWSSDALFNDASPRYRVDGATLPIIFGAIEQGKWSGYKSTEWCDCANWMHLKVPTASTNVTIPNNPKRTILLNDHADSLAVCNNLTLAGSTIKGKDGSQITINGNITFADGVMDFTDSAVTVIVYGDWSQDTVTNFIPGGSTVQFVKNGSQNITLSGDGTQRIDFNNLTISGTSGTKFFNDDITIKGNLNINTGTVFAPKNVDIKGNWVNNNPSIDGFTEGTYTVTFSGTSQQTITKTSSNEFFNILNITNSSSDGVTLGSHITANKIDLGANGVFKAGGTERTITIYNPADGNGLDGAANAIFDLSGPSHTLYMQCTNPNIHASAVKVGNFSTINYNRSGNQEMITNLTSYANLSFGGSGTKNMAYGPLTVARHFTINSSAVVNSTINSIAVGGNYKVYGDAAIDLTNVNITFNGTANQEITGDETFYDITLNNPFNSVILNNNLTLNNTATFTNGVISTGSYRLDLGNAATINETETSFITGNVRVTRNIGNTSGTQTFGNIGLELTENNTINNSTQVTRVTGTALQGNASCCGSNWSIQRYFDIEPATNTGLNASMVYRYFDHELNGVNESDLVLFRADLPFGGSDPWTAMKGTVNASANTLSISNIDKFSRWAAASDASPLPVELLIFNAHLQDGKVVLNWSTASETNNAYFTVERSRDMKTVIPIATVTGAGNSNQLINYESVDDKPLSQISYYRLRQTDYDGTSTTSNWIKIINNEMGSELKIMRAVVQNNELNIFVACPDKSEYNLEVYDITGNCLYNNLIQPQSELMQHTVFLNKPQNMYIIKAGDNKTIKTLKVVK